MSVEGISKRRTMAGTATPALSAKFTLLTCVAASEHDLLGPGALLRSQRHVPIRWTLLGLVRPSLTLLRLALLGLALLRRTLLRLALLSLIRLILLTLRSCP
jgi:hypothetical protein